MDHEDFDLTNPYEYDKENSHLQFEETDWFHGVHQTTGVPHNIRFMFNKTFEKITKEVLFKQNHTKEIKLDLKKYTLLEKCSTMDLL